MKTQTIGSVWAGPYIDKPGAVLMVGTNGQVAHLTAEQCRQLAQLLTEAAKVKAA